MKPEVLHEEVARRLDELIARMQRPGEWPSEPDGVLEDAVERALIDPHYHTTFVRHLRTRLGSLLPGHLPPTKEDTEQIVGHGLGEIPPPRLAQLAVDAVALICLRTAIFEREELSDYWWQRATQFAQQRRPLRTPEQLVQTIRDLARQAGAVPLVPAPDFPPRPDEAAAREPSLLQALESRATDEQPATRPERPDRWTIAIPLDSRELTWIVPDKPPSPADPNKQVLNLLIAWWSRIVPSVLEIRLGGFTFLQSGVECTARLLDAGGQEVGLARNEEGRLRFTGLADPAGLVLEGEFREGDQLHFRFRTSLTRR